MFKVFVSVLLLICMGLQSGEEETLPGGPWLMGPLISPSGTVMDKGKWEVEAYLVFGAKTGEYNQHWHVESKPNVYTLNPELFIYYGIAKGMDIFLMPQMVYNKTEGQSSVNIGDFPVLIDFQLVEPSEQKWRPAVKLGIGTTFPLGKYQKLNPRKKQTDSTGAGSFQANSQLVFYKLFHLKEKKRYLSTYLSFSYAIYPPVHVKGFNAYGGGDGTYGKVFPGNLSTVIFSFEYTLTRNWVFAMDNVYAHTNKTRFSGRNGVVSGEPALSTEPSSENINFCPAIEYNFNKQMAISAGVWFSAFGRNSEQFRNGIIAFYYAN